MFRNVAEYSLADSMETLEKQLASIQGTLDMMLKDRVRVVGMLLDFATGNGEIRDFVSVSKEIDALKEITKIRNQMSSARARIDRIPPESRWNNR